MTDIIHALKTTHFEWKPVSPYQLWCQRIQTEENDLQKRVPPVKMVVQLYRYKEGQYLIDFKKLDGELFPFFEMTFQLFVELDKRRSNTYSSTTTPTNHYLSGF